MKQNYRHVIRYLVLYVFFTLSGKSFSQNWQLVWQDDFNSISSDWTFETGGNGWGNNELQYYRQENASIANGNLIITAKREDYGGRNYTSSRMKTQGRKFWKYGKIEARIAVPAIQGIWPAFWMLGENISSVGWPACGEIDIMEHVNTDNINHGTIHWANPDGSHTSYGGTTDVGTITNYHTYSIEWNSSSIKWFVDGIQYHEANIANNINSTEEFHESFFIILNVAVGGNWPGNTIDNNSMPSSMKVDYIRVYEDVPVQPQTSFGGTAATIPGKIEVENYDNGGQGVAFHDVDVSNNGGQFRTDGVDIEASSDNGGGYNIGWTSAGEWQEYTVNVTTAGKYIMQSRVASPASGNTFHVELDGQNISGSLAVPNTGGWQTYQTVGVTTPTITSGQHVLRIYEETGGFNINYLNFIAIPNTPVISSASTATAIASSSFNYTITATNNPTSYNATGLPTGLSVNTSTGLISGSPTVTGTFNATISATNSGGTGSKTLTISVNPALPVITSAVTASGTTGSSFSYQITASNSPSSYGATGLPAGLTVHTSSGVISGTPTVAGIFNSTISASNVSGTASKTVTITITAPQTDRKKVVAYVPNWIDLTSYSNAIDYAKLTHINIAFENPVNSSGDLSYNPANDALISKAHANNVKICMSIGGGSVSGDQTIMNRYFNLINNTNRAAFVTKLYNFIVSHNLDGLDVDLEGPAINGDYGVFIQALSEKFRPNGKLLTAALSQGYGGGSVPNSVFQYLDFVNIMAYDATGPWDPNTPGQHSSLAFAQSNTAYWLNRGLERSKAVLGVPFYGYGFGNDYSQRDYPYNQIVAAYPGAENTDQVGSTIWYNGIPTIKAKTNYALDQNIAGIMIWSLDYDAAGSKSLLTAIDQTIKSRTQTQGPFNNTIASIPGKVEAENFDTGGQGMAYNDMDVANNGGQYRTEGVDIEVSSDSGYNIGWTAAGEWLEYTVAVASSGTYSMQARVASTSAGKSFHIEMDGATVATVPVPNTGAWQTYQTVTVTTATISAGNHIMRIFMDTDGFNLNYLNFTPVVSAPVISSIGTATGTKSISFNYQITASNSPTSYAASGLPAGLSVNTSSGLISGTPTIAGTYQATISATNTGGTGSKTITITISDPAINTPYGGITWAIPGTIQAENYDDGGEGVAYHDNDAINSGGQQRTNQGVDVQTTGDATGTYNIGWAVAGEWLKYTVNVAATGIYTLQTRVASPNSGKSFHIEMDGVTIATVAVPNTGAWQTYQTVTVTTANISAGNHIMRIYMDTDGFNLNYLNFAASASQASIYRIKNRWQNTYLYDAGDRVRYSATTSGTSYQWVLEDVGGGVTEIKNLGTGEYMHIENQYGYVQCTPRTAGWTSSRWTMEDVSAGIVRFKNEWQPTQYIHIENLQNQAQYGSIDASWWSAQWILEPVNAAKLSVNYTEAEEQVTTLSPNPVSNGFISIHTTELEGEVEVTILNEQGATVYSGNQQVENSSVTISVSQLKGGIYILRLQQNDSFIYQKFIVQ